MFLEECLHKWKILQNDTIDFSKEIGINKTSASKEYINCHYLNNLDKEFKFQPFVCNGFHDVSMMSFSVSNLAVSNTHGADYRCIIFGITKKIDLSEVSRSL